MNVKYKILFSAELMHTYYKNGLCPNFSIVPSSATQRAMKGLGLLYKNTGNSLVVLSKADDSGKPVMEIPAKEVFTFYLQLNDGHFYNYTNIPVPGVQAECFYFTNINVNNDGGNLYVSKPLPAHSLLAAYTPLQLATDSGNCYECIKSNTGAALTDTSTWVNRGAKQFVQPEDTISVVKDNFQFSVASSNQFTIKVLGFNTTNGNFDLPVIPQVTQVFETPQTAVNVDLTGAPFGKYCVDVNGTKKMIYYDSRIFTENIFGVIEIYNHLANGSSFSLLANDGSIAEKKFVIQFANRLLMWKYIARTADITGLDDTSGKYSFSLSSPKQFLSGSPIPVSETPITTFSMKSALLGNIKPVANPGINRISTVMKDGDKYYCVEQHLNY